MRRQTCEARIGGGLGVRGDQCISSTRIRPELHGFAWGTPGPEA